MKTNHIAQLPFGGLINHALSPDEIENTTHNLVENTWLAIRKQQMDISPNALFPGTKHTSFSRQLKSLKMVVMTLVKVLVR